MRPRCPHCDAPLFLDGLQCPCGKSRGLLGDIFGRARINPDEVDMYETDLERKLAPWPVKLGRDDAKKPDITTVSMMASKHRVLDLVALREIMTDAQKKIAERMSQTIARARDRMMDDIFGGAGYRPEPWPREPEDDRLSIYARSYPLFTPRFPSPFIHVDVGGDSYPTLHASVKIDMTPEMHRINRLLVNRRPENSRRRMKRLTRLIKRELGRQGR